MYCLPLSLEPPESCYRLLTSFVSFPVASDMNRLRLTEIAVGVLGGHLLKSPQLGKGVVTVCHTR